MPFFSIGIFVFNRILAIHRLVGDTYLGVFVIIDYEVRSLGELNRRAEMHLCKERLPKVLICEAF